MKKWFNGGHEFDAEIRRLFRGFMYIILDSEEELHKVWLSTLKVFCFVTLSAHWSLGHDPYSLSKGTVAYVLIADQFTRNVYRGTPKAFAYDAHARSVVHDSVQRGTDERIFKMHPAFASFLFMPFMHSEELPDHDLLAQRQEWMLSSLAKDDPFYPFIEAQVGHAQHHRDIIAKFGRYPQRNVEFVSLSMVESLYLCLPLFFQRTFSDAPLRRRKFNSSKTII